jgi:Amt family ammonium transporter
MFLQSAKSLNTMWVMIGAIMILMMQLGFALLEAGSVREKNSSNILLKNLLDTFAGIIAFYLAGYGFANE